MAPKRNRRKLGARQYRNYSDEMLSLAVELVRKNTINSYDAEKQFSIPRRTIEKKIRGLHSDKPGRPFKFTDEEESAFVKVLVTAADFGFPLTRMDLRMVVHEYLEKNNKTHLFDNKPPGEYWVNNFIKRHVNELTVRSTQNIKKVRAEKTVEEFKEYFQNLEQSLKDIPASHILNYDETNVSDNPGALKCIFRRGVKYPELIMNYSKGSISVMFAGVATGDLLPPYVVYKSEYMWSQWCDGGLDEARYNRTKSGWFDSIIFLDWLKTIVIPWARKLKGPKVLIGDNLSSHLNFEVIDLCEMNNIRFVFLPPSSTHLTQPLDVAFFGPLKKAWRRILNEYKIQNPKQASLNKNHFPLLLKKLIEDSKINQKTNIISGFRATGIVPFDPRQVYKKLPEYTEQLNTKHSVDKVLLNFLKENRKPNPINRRKNKKIHVQAGKSVSTSDFTASNETGQNLNPTDLDDDESNGFEEDVSILNAFSFNPLEVESNIAENMPSTSKENVFPSESGEQSHRLDSSTMKNFAAGDFVVVKFIYNAGTKKAAEKRFVGQVINAVEDSHVFVKFMRKSNKAENTFIFPQVDDEQLVLPEDDILKVVPLNVSRGRHVFPKFIKEYSCA